MKIKKCIGDEYFNNIDEKKIILTTDQDLIKDGVQAIDDEFLQWFVKNPSCEFIDTKLIQSSPLKGFIYNYEYKIIIPKEEPKQETKQETLEDAKIRFIENMKSINPTGNFLKFINLAIDFGAKWQQERSYSEEEVEDLIYKENLKRNNGKRIYTL
jgi:hypothetical protein